MNKKAEMSKWIQNEFNKRKLKNTKLSMRNFATLLGISKSSLNNVLNGKTSLSKSSIETIASNLKLNEKDKNYLMSLIDVKKTNIKSIENEYYDISPHDLEIISDWCFVAILSLAQFQSNEASIDWIISKINVSESKAKEVLDLTIKLNLIEIKNNKMIRTTAPLRFFSEIPSELIRKYHKANLKLAETAIEKLHMNERILGAISIPTNKKLLKKTDSLIEKFKQDISKTLGTTEPDSVYTLAIQLFPITK